MKGIVRSNDRCYIGDIRRQITNLKAQYLQLRIKDPHTYSEENYVKGVKSICSRVAKHFGEKFDKNAPDLKQEINNLIAKLPKLENEDEQTRIEETQDEAVAEKSGS